MKPFDFAELWVPKLAPWEVALRAAIVYLFVQVVFRLAGRKELGRWGVSEVALLFLVTTTVRTSIVGNDTSLTTAMVGLTTIVVLDRMASVIAARSARAADWVEGPVRHLVRGGEPQEETMRKTRVSRHDLEERAREQGRRSLEGLEDAFLERSGKITLIFRDR